MRKSLKHDSYIDSENDIRNKTNIISNKGSIDCEDIIIRKRKKHLEKHYTFT